MSKGHGHERLISGEEKGSSSFYDDIIREERKLWEVLRANFSNLPPKYLAQ